MRRTGVTVWLVGSTLIVSSNAANSSVLISSFRFKLCVTGAKHPDGCMRIDADARVVVRDDAMDALEAEIGQGATITQVPDRNSVPAPSGQGSHRRHSQQ